MVQVSYLQTPTIQNGSQLQEIQRFGPTQNLNTPQQNNGSIVIAPKSQDLGGQNTSGNRPAVNRTPFRQSPQIRNGLPNTQTPMGNVVPLGQRSSLLGNQQYVLTPPQAAQVDFKNENGYVTMVARNATVADVLNVLAEKEKISFVLSGASLQTVSFSLQNIPAPQALTSILAVSGHTWTEQNGIVYVTPNAQDASNSITPELSGKVVRVFDLDYASAKNISEVVAGMLSAKGKSYMVESESTDNRKTAEQIIVEDYPGVVQRIENYIAQADRPPRQVLIEAYVLEIDLSEDNRHGVNFENLASISGKNFSLSTIGVTPTAASTFVAQIDTPNLKSVVDLLKVQNDTKTLASPKVMVINGQESRLQIGQQLGFRVLTNTQTGNTLEDVQFLDVGVVLSVTPRISRDGQIMMKVKPEVSSGQINTDTGLPEEETSEVETSVLLSDGKGMVIGGLIQERDSIVHSKVPVLGNLKGVGALFRREIKEKSRSEIVFVLIPRIIEPDQVHAAQDEVNRWNSLERRKSEYLRGTSSLFDCEDCQTPRPSFNPPLSPIHRDFNGTNYRSYESFQGNSVAPAVTTTNRYPQNLPSTGNQRASYLSREYRKPFYPQPSRRQQINGTRRSISD